MINLKHSLLPVITFIKIDVRRLFRDKVAIFFVFFFPFIFLIIFGTIFSGSNDISFKVALINDSKTEFSKKFSQDLRDNEVFDIDAGEVTLNEAREKMRRGQIDTIVSLPENFGEVDGSNSPAGQAIILYDQNNEQASRTVASIMEAIFKDINAEFNPSVESFSVKTESTSQKGLRQFDYTFAGILGFTLLSLGVFGPTTVFPRLKQRGVLRRYRTTPLKVWQYFVGNVVSNSIIGLIAVGLMFISAVVLFDLEMRGNYLNLALVVVMGTVLMFGIGLSLGGWAKNENQAAPLAQLVALPMMFLSGVFFPTFLMPDLLQNITRYIPLTPIVDSVRLIITEGATLVSLMPQLTIIAGWTVIIYIIAFKLFRWE